MERREGEDGEKGVGKMKRREGGRMKRREWE